MRADDCIAALATAPGAAGVSIVRVSGADALRIGDTLLPSDRLAVSRRPANTFFHTAIYHPHSRELVDDALILIFHAPNSYTGENTIELQGHGGRVAAQRLLAATLAAGARMAEPGEFTRRAFMSGRLDLTQAEAVCDLVQARTERAAQSARAQLDGLLGSRIVALYEDGVGISAEIERMLDFEEGELPEHFLSEVAHRIGCLCAKTSKLLSTWSEGHLVRDGARIVIGGRPNVGKSSLMNALLQRNRAIVHEQPGTTRDTLEEFCELEGVPLCLVDTAGLRETGDAVEAEGIGRARNMMQQADLIVYLVDQSVPRALQCAREIRALPDKPVIFILSKCDLLPGDDFTEAERSGYLRLSVKTGQGLDQFKAAILKALGISADYQGEPLVASLRHRQELQEALAQAHLAQELLREGTEQLVLAAGHLRNVAEALGRITGRVYSEDLLDSIFSRFCVGK